MKFGLEFFCGLRKLACLRFVDLLAGEGKERKLKKLGKERNGKEIRCFLFVLTVIVKWIVRPGPGVPSHSQRKQTNTNY